MKIHAGGEYVRVARKRQRCQQSAVRAAPNADALGINITQPLQILRPCLDISVLRGAAPTAIGRFTKGTPIHNAQPVIDGQHHVTQACQILILGVGVVVVVYVVEPKQHLPWRAAVDEDKRRARLCMALGDKKLAVYFQAIVTLEYDLLWLN